MSHRSPEDDPSSRKTVPRPLPSAMVAIAAAILLAAAPQGLRAQEAPTEAAAVRPSDAHAPLLEGSVKGLLPDSLRTEVLVLGTTHLSNYGEQFRPELLDSLIGGLAEWGPDAIGVERDPPGVYRRIGAEREPEYARAAQQELGVSLERALTVSDSLLEEASAGELSAEARLDLVGHLVAATRLPTATLHWTRLPANARSRSALPPEALEALEARADGVANEVYSVGVRLARELDLARVYDIDDHTSDRVYDLEAAVARGLGKHLTGHPTYDSVQVYVEEGKRRTADAIEDGDLLPYYRWKNDLQNVSRDVRLQWGIFLDLADRTPTAQKRLAHWEIRNLKMVTHIREMALHHPGGRILVVVGAGHKAFFDAYLDRMLDVEIVQLDEVLEPPSSAADLDPNRAGERSVPHYRIDARIEPDSGRVDVELAMRWVPEAPTDTLAFLLHRDLGRPTIESDAVQDVRVEPLRRFMKAFDSDTSYQPRRAGPRPHGHTRGPRRDSVELRRDAPQRAPPARSQPPHR